MGAGVQTFFTTPSGLRPISLDLTQPCCKACASFLRLLRIQLRFHKKLGAERLQYDNFWNDVLHFRRNRHQKRPDAVAGSLRFGFCRPIPALIVAKPYPQAFS